MNSWLDRGFFMLVYFGIIYFVRQGEQPTWGFLFIGAAFMLFVGAIIAATKADILK